MGASEGPEHPRDTLRRLGLAARPRMGQNFLVSPEVFDRILEASGPGPQTVVLEIGAGLGRLTERLAARAGVVLAVEIDRGLARAARERLAPLENVRLIEGDFLETKHRISPRVTESAEELRRGGPLRVISNLPYGISSPAVINLLEWSVPLDEVDVMLQAEVAGRLGACPGGPEYGPLTVFARYHAQVEDLFGVPASAFWPRPAVASRFIRLLPRRPSPEAADYETFRAVVGRLFQQRRKTLSRALRIGWDRAAAEKVLERTGLEGRRRPGTLGVGEFVEVADALYGVLEAD